MTPASALHAVGRPDWLTDHLYFRSLLAVPGRDDTTEVLGQTDAGRLLLVVVTDAGDGRDFVVTARDMTVAEKRAFRKRSR